MVKRHPIRFFFLVLLIQIILVFSLNVMARSEESAHSYEGSGQFFLVDADQNSLPDHLGYTLQMDNWVNTEFWVCGELQAKISGDTDQNWQTIAYTGQYFPTLPHTGEGTPQNSVREARIYFYGGEIRRLKLNGPFRLIIRVKGVELEEKQTFSFSPSYKYTEFETSDLILCGGQQKKTSEVLELVEDWAKKQGVTLGSLREATYNFDRWRLDYQGFSTVSSKRVWVQPGGEISWVNIGS